MSLKLGLVAIRSLEMNAAKFCQIVILLLFALNCVSAQETDSSDCKGPIYKGKEVTRKVKLTSHPEPERPKDASKVTGLVVLDVVACKDGRITNIEVVQGQPYGTTEAAIKAARKAKFRPAEKDGEVVSQRMRFEYNFKL